MVSTHLWYGADSILPIAWHVLHKGCNYNIIFQKLDILVIKMLAISTCYTSGWGISLIIGLF